MSKRRDEDKFQFGVDFQESILQYTVSDKHGYKALQLYEDTHFTLLSHSFIAHCLKRYFKTKKRIPGKTVLKEKLRELYTNRDYAKLMTEDLSDEINRIVDTIYASLPKDGDDILEGVIKFSQYINLKHEWDTTDLKDFNNYSKIESKIRKALNIGKSLDRRRGTKLIGGMESRIMDRDNEPDGKPTPYWQWNRSLNGGSLKKGALVMFMSKAKRFKTGVLVNLSLRQLTRKGKGLYIDLENGEKNITSRGDQSMAGTAKETLSHPAINNRLLKQARKYKRLGSELVIVRLPSLQTTCSDIQALMDEYRLEEGLTFNFVIIDYGDLLGDVAGTKEEIARISNAYLDMKNLAELNDLDFIATASHVKGDKETVNREKTKYIAEDVAKCKEKIRHLDVCWGLQQTPEEKEANVMRWEIIEQRDGPGDFTAYFWVDIPKQRLKEFTREQVKEYRNQVEESEKDKADQERAKESRKRKTSDL